MKKHLVHSLKQLSLNIIIVLPLLKGLFKNQSLAHLLPANEFVFLGDT